MTTPSLDFPRMQALTEMIICNESRAAKSRVVTGFNRARQCMHTLLIRHDPMTTSSNSRHFVPSAMHPFYTTI